MPNFTTVKIIIKIIIIKIIIIIIMMERNANHHISNESTAEHLERH